MWTNADQNSSHGSCRYLVMTRALIWLMPLYVLAFTALGALFGPHRQHASVPTAAVIAAGTGALLFFAAGIHLAASWERQRRTAVQNGRRTGAAQAFLDRHPHLSELLVVAVGSPSNHALGWLIGLALSGGTSYGLTLALTAAFHGAPVALLASVNIASYTVLVATATYLNSRTTAPDI